MKKMTNENLAKLYNRIAKTINHQELWTGKINNLYYDLINELNRRNHALIFKAACKYCKNHGQNQFYAARNYADAAINDCNYFESDTTHEISGFYTKTGNPVVVDLVMHD